MFPAGSRTGDGEIERGQLEGSPQPFFYGSVLEAGLVEAGL